DKAIEDAILLIQKADVLIVGGTSLNVYPAAGLINFFRGKHLILINKTQTLADRSAKMIIREPIGEVLGKAVLDR
ncbi:MAG: NAD-dependent protein deacylase, partial [Clostridiaceae bacterium]|nr:NAD-dependent protein deacylase [Clostridiaceae bacterium]